MIITRVYNNGGRVVKELGSVRAEAEILENKDFRPGVAVFRDAECVQVGYLGAERCAEIAEELRIKIKEQLS